MSEPCQIPSSAYPMQKIYEEAGFCTEGARRLAGLFEVVQRIRARRKRQADSEQVTTSKPE